MCLWCLLSRLSGREFLPIWKKKIGKGKMCLYQNWFSLICKRALFLDGKFNFMIRWKIL